MQKCDAHTHLFPPEIIKNRVAYCERDPGFKLIYGSPKARMIGAVELLAAMEAADIQQAVILSAPWQDPGLTRLHNDFLLDAAAASSGRLLPFICPSLTNPEEALKEIDRLKNKPVRGLGEIAFYAGAWRDATPPVIPPLLEAAQKLFLPVMLHVNEQVGHDYHGKAAMNLGALYQTIAAHPDVDFMLAHLGGGLAFYELMPEVKKTFKRVYYDSAAQPLLYTPQVYRVLRDILSPGKLLYGSDYPLLPASRYEDAIAAAGLTAAETEAFFKLNFARLFSTAHPL